MTNLSTNTELLSFLLPDDDLDILLLSSDDDEHSEAETVVYDPPSPVHTSTTFTWYFTPTAKAKTLMDSRCPNHSPLVLPINPNDFIYKTPTREGYIPTCGGTVTFRQAARKFEAASIQSPPLLKRRRLHF